jgi:hypothetical protein
MHEICETGRTFFPKTDAPNSFELGRLVNSPPPKSVRKISCRQWQSSVCSKLHNYEVFLSPWLSKHADNAIANEGADKLVGRTSSCEGVKGGILIDLAERF